MIRRTTKIALAAAAALAALASPPAAVAQTSCASANDVVTVRMTEHHDGVELSVKNGRITIFDRGTQIFCTGAIPTTQNTDTVLITDTSDNFNTPAGGDGDTSVAIADPAGFGPGATPESGSAEIEFLADMRGGNDRLSAGGVTKQDIVVGNEGLSWNADEDRDVIGMPFDYVSLEARDFADRLSGQGGRGTGAPLSTAQEFSAAGGHGADLLRGSEGHDEIFGGADADNIDAGGGDDLLVGLVGDDIVNGGAGEDSVYYGFSDNGVTVDLAQTAAQDTGEGRDTLAGLEKVVGSPNADRLTGTAGANVLDGGDGDDTLDGRGGADELRGGGGTDAASYAAASGPVTIDLSLTTQPDGDRFFSIEDAIGSPFADSLTGNLVANRIVGGAGTDTIATGAGADRVEIRDSEGDRVSCGADADTAVSDRRTLDALDADCETVDALPEPTGGGTTGGATSDSALSFTLTAAARQRVLRQRSVQVKVRCPLEPCTTVASGSGRLRAVRSRGLRATTLTLAPVTKGVPAGATRTLRLRLNRKRLAALGKALAAGQRPTFKVIVRARDASGNTVPRTVRVRATRL